MKKKILSLCVVLALAVTAIIGGTLAYFSDTDNQTNVFTTGNVEIDLWEDFGDNEFDPNNKHVGIEELHPVTFDEDGNRIEDNVIEKEIYVTNTGTEDAYVRLHIAIPAELEVTSVYDATNGVLHFSYEDNAVAGKWDWSNAYGDSDYTTKSNKYTKTINNIVYNVYVVTYETALATDDVTVDAISTVWMDSMTTNEDVAELKDKLGEEWKIFVAAEATQAEGFANAYQALNVAFGKPGAYEVDWDSVVGDTFKNN